MARARYSPLGCRQSHALLPRDDSGSSCLRAYPLLLRSLGHSDQHLATPALCLSLRECSRERCGDWRRPPAPLAASPVRRSISPSIGVIAPVSLPTLRFTHADNRCAGRRVESRPSPFARCTRDESRHRPSSSRARLGVGVVDLPCAGCLPRACAPLLQLHTTVIIASAHVTLKVARSCPREPSFARVSAPGLSACRARPSGAAPLVHDTPAATHTQAGRTAPLRPRGCECHPARPARETARPCASGLSEDVGHQLVESRTALAAKRRQRVTDSPRGLPTIQRSTRRRGAVSRSISTRAADALGDRVQPKYELPSAGD